MARPNNSTLLLPLMAVIALIYPFAFSPKLPAPSGSALQHASGPSHQDSSSPSLNSPAGREKAEAHTAKAILKQFFGDTLIDPNDASESPIRAGYQLDFMFVTIPDPVDSRLPYLFDRNLTTIQRAAETDSYVLASFDLPWLEEIRARAAANSESANSVGAIHDHHHEYETHPGYLLFRQEQMTPLATTRALLVFLIGETPTTGIQKGAMTTALDEATWLCRNSLAQETAAEGSRARLSNIAPPADCREFKILGPSFSGSAQSLDFALHSWMESRKPVLRPRFRIVSGTATAVPTCSDIFRFANDPDAVKDWKADHAYEHRPTFSATIVRDKTALNFILKFLNDSRRDTSEPFQVALLTEGNTAYGSSLRETVQKRRRLEEPSTAAPNDRSSSCKEPPLVITPVDLPFPLHISRLRSESERVRKQRESAQQNPQDFSSSFSLPLPTEDDSGEAKDSAPSVSQLDVSASELMLSNLLSTISRERFQYVGIAATDVRDVIFLAREIRQHSPATVIFALNADLIYSHPEAYAYTRGILVATPYPLFALNQSWMKPATPQDGGTRYQFPDQDTEGIYNAALYLLDKDQPLLEYASPFALPYRHVSIGSGTDQIVLGRTVPPLWIVTVGRDGFWPVDVSALEKEDASWSSYTLPAVPLAVSATQDKCPPQPLKRSNRGIVPQLTHAVLILWGFLCIVPAMMFLSRISPESPHEKPAQWRLVTRFSHWMVRSFQLNRLFRLGTIDAKCFFLIGGTASLSVYAIALTAYSISAIETPNSLRWAFLTVMVVIVLLGLAACGQLVVDTFRGMKSKDGENASGVERFNSHWFAVPILVGVGLCWICTAWLIGTWISFGGKHPGQGIVTGFRAVNLQNGVSPLVPLFCIGLAAILWVYCSLRRICFQQEIFASDAPVTEACNASRLEAGSAPFQNELENRCETPFFYSNLPPFQGLLTLEKKLLRMLECPTLLSADDSRVAMGVTMALALFWGGYLFFYRLVFAFEARAFYWLLGVTFLLVVAGILSNVLRVFLLWKEIVAILRRLGELPMRDAFTRFREHNRTLPRMTLTTAPAPLTVMGVSIAAASDLYNAGQSARRVLGEAPEIDRAFGHGNDLIVDARNEHEKALECHAQGNREDCNLRQRQAQCHLNQITRNVEAILTLSWNTLLAKGARFERVEKARQELEEQAEEFLVSRTVHFLSHMFPQLTNLASYSIGCLFLMLMAISSYPLQPKNPFAYFCWFIIFAFVGVVLHMAVQMNRDAVLSCLNGTKPGEINWDAGFIGRLVLLVVVPVLGLVGVQFPDTISQILQWIAPAGAGHP